MVEAKRRSAWRRSYDLTLDGRPVARWDSSYWKSSGTIEVDGRRFRMRGNAWGTKFTMADEMGGVVATADRVGRKQWTVEAGGRTFHFRRASLWNDTQHLYDGDEPVGHVRRTSWWRGDVAADLPGLPLPVQVFVIGVVITMWDAQAAAAAS
jgi:hypothetical protein